MIRAFTLSVDDGHLRFVADNVVVDLGPADDADRQLLARRLSPDLVRALERVAVAVRGGEGTADDILAIVDKALGGGGA